jgi:GNAT superfamily N-acetyltransferase
MKGVPLFSLRRYLPGNKMDIKPISESDLHELASLQKELIDEESDIERMIELFPTIQKDGNYYLLGAQSEGRLVASLAGIVCHDLFGKCIPYMIVENVIVSKDMRQQGIGTRLMMEIERIALERGCRYIMLVSSAKRKNARDFYHRLGYDSANYRGFKKLLST